MNSSELFGGVVIGGEGWKIGEVKHLVVEPSGWQGKALEVQPFANIAEEFGMKEMLGGTHVSIGVERIKSVGDTVVLKISRAQLKSMLQSGSLKK